MSAVAGEELVGAEAGEEHAGTGCVGFGFWFCGGGGWGCVEGALASRGEVEGTGDGEIHFCVVGSHEELDEIAVGEGFGVGDVDGDEAPGAGWTGLLEFGEGGAARYSVWAVFVD